MAARRAASSSHGGLVFAPAAADEVPVGGGGTAMDNRRVTLPSVLVRTRFLIRALALAGALSAVVAGPAPAQMSVAKKVLADYATDGAIDPCKHTSDELRQVQKNIPPDFEQYAP